MNSVVITIPRTPITMNHQVALASRKPTGRIRKPTSFRTQKETPITAKAAQATKAPRPWAVMIA
jgi:hypothetical protein